MRLPRPFLIVCLLFVLLDLLYLRWIWVHFGNWGFWDWDYQQTLLETARVSLLGFGQIPLWNPFLGGGVTLAGNTLNHTFSPCFLLILLFGTVTGIKACIVLYALVGQIGMYRLARALDMGRFGAFFAGLLYVLGGVYAQRLTHGHFEWIALAWYPYVLWMIERLMVRFRWSTVAVGGLFMAFVFLDGGPYQFVFFMIFACVYTLFRDLRVRRLSVFPALCMVFVFGAGLAAVKLFPVYETVKAHPRKIVEDNFYGAPFKPTASGLLYQAFLSRDQEHSPRVWMPYRLNVGCYLGWVPVLLALLALGFRGRRRWPLIVTGLFFLWTMVGTAVSFSPWDLLKGLPGLSMLRVPSRFNIFVVLVIALLAGEGLECFRERFRKHRITPWLAGLVVLLVGVDLIWVNGRIFKVAFSIPPVKVEKEKDFKQYMFSPFFETYKKTVLYELYDHWICADYPAVLQNRGVIESYRTIPFLSYAIPFDFQTYRGEAWFEVGGGRVRSVRITPNRIRVETNARGGLLVINQNYDPGWKAELPHRSIVTTFQGLLAVELPPSRSDAVLIYRPASVIKGAWCSLFFLVSLIAILFFAKKNHPSMPRKGA